MSQFKRRPETPIEAVKFTDPLNPPPGVLCVDLVWRPLLRHHAPGHSGADRSRRLGRH